MHPTPTDNDSRSKQDPSPDDSAGRVNYRFLAQTGFSLLGIFLLFFLLGLNQNDSVAGISTVDSRDFLEQDRKQGTLHLSSVVLIDSMKSALPLKVFMNDLKEGDTTKIRVMLFGDSEVEFLRTSVYNYCVNNNCELAGSVVWYGSSTIAWANSDTIDYYLEKFKPDFVFCVLGLNEVVVPNVEPRRKYINSIAETVRNYGANFYWIGPAAWKEDMGICAVMHEELGDTAFFPSQHLTLERGPDKRHPSMEASKIWFDSVAVAVTRNTHLNFGNKVTEYVKPVGSPFLEVARKKN